jgi:hypothetical protein
VRPHLIAIISVDIWICEDKNDCGFARDNVKLYFDKTEEWKRNDFVRRMFTCPPPQLPFIERLFLKHLRTVRLSGLLFRLYLWSLVSGETSEMLFSGQWMFVVGEEETKINRGREREKATLGFRRINTHNSWNLVFSNCYF